MQLKIQWLFIIFFISVASSGVNATIEGQLVLDTENRWGHNASLNSRSAGYIVCDGYIGSPLLPNNSAIKSFKDNCEVTPPPGVPGAIDVPENHSTKYPGYKAYTLKSRFSKQTLFVCDGFVNSTAWCSLEAQRKAEKLRRVTKPRNWELGSKPLFINDRPVYKNIREHNGRHSHHAPNDCKKDCNPSFFDRIGGFFNNLLSYEDLSGSNEILLTSTVISGMLDSPSLGGPSSLFEYSPRNLPIMAQDTNGFDLAEESDTPLLVADGIVDHTLESDIIPASRSAIQHSALYESLYAAARVAVDNAFDNYLE